MGDGDAFGLSGGAGGVDDVGGGCGVDAAGQGGSGLPVVENTGEGRTHLLTEQAGTAMTLLLPETLQLALPFEHPPSAPASRTLRPMLALALRHLQRLRVSMEILILSLRSTLTTSNLALPILTALHLY